MIPNKRDLKAYVRYDGRGMVVPSSVILARKKPKVGKWTEIEAYQCCIPSSSYPNVYVCGAGTDVVNGRYVYAGMIHGKPYYTKGIYVISWGEYGDDDPDYQDWEIYNSTLPDEDKWYYYSGQDVFTPDKVGHWIADHGDLPSPVVLLEACPTSPFYICIAGLKGDHTDWNGTYIYINNIQGRPHYQKEGNYDIYWDETQWWIGDIIYSNDDVADPTLVTIWVGTGGTMTITEGSCVFPDGCYTVTLTCTEEEGTAVFGVNYCYDESYITFVTYGNPMDVCCYSYPVLLDGYGTMELGDECTTTTTTTEVPATTTTTTTFGVPSDIRLKENIIPTGGKVGEFTEYTWTWNEKAINLGLDTYPTSGAIAQDVMEIHPEAVRKHEDGYYRVNYNKL